MIDAIDITTAAATLGRKGGSVKSPRKAATSAANGAKGGAPTKAERAERIEYYRKLEEAGHQNRVRRYEPVSLDSYPVAVRAALAGRKVRICEQDYLSPIDQSRADRGLVSGLANRTRVWVEVDGVRLGSDRPTLEEIAGSLSGTV